MSKETIARFELALEGLVGLECWGVVAGAGTGSIIKLALGEKILRKTRIDNPNLSDYLQNYIGERELMVECAWRLENVTNVICSSTSSNERDGPMLVGLNQLVGQHIESVKLYKPGWDLTLNFSRSLILHVFCDQTNTVDAYDNYSLFCTHEVLTVGASSELSVE